MPDSKRARKVAATILVVEDSATQAERLRSALEEHDFRVAVARNGREALEYLEGNAPTVVLSDVVMPEIDGYRLCKSIKTDERLRDIPVILLTTLSDPEDILKGLECGADSFVTKPYDEDMLLSRIDYVLLNLEMRKRASTEMGIEIVFAGRKHFIASSRIQILDLLLSSYESAIQQNRELEKTSRELTSANDTIRSLSGLIPICAQCKKIRDEAGEWVRLEKYIKERSQASFTHGFCPECAKTLYYDKMKR